MTDALNEATCAIPLRDKSGATIAWALVDQEDFAELNRFRWHRLRRADGRFGYVRRTSRINGRHVVYWMAREIMHLGPRGDDMMDVDHIDGNVLDNCKSNLRVIPHAGNQQNRAGGYGRSRFRGVTMTKSGKWNAYVHMGGRRHDLGRHDDEDQAAKAAAAFRREHMPYSTMDQV